MKLSPEKIKELMLVINLQLFEEGVINEATYQTANEKIRKV